MRGARCGTRKYSSAQAVTGKCKCFYDYAGTSKDPLFRLEDFPAMKSSTTWLHERLNLPPKERFNDIVANKYSRAGDEQTPWHTENN